MNLNNKFNIYYKKKENEFKKRLTTLNSIVNLK